MYSASAAVNIHVCAVETLTLTAYIVRSQNQISRPGREQWVTTSDVVTPTFDPKRYHPAQGHWKQTGEGGWHNSQAQPCYQVSSTWLRLTLLQQNVLLLF